MQFLIAVSHKVGANTKLLNFNITDSHEDGLIQLDIPQASTLQVNAVPVAAAAQIYGLRLLRCLPHSHL